MTTTETAAGNDRRQKRQGDRVSVNVSDRVLKPVPEVFTAIIEPAQLSRFFISSGSGRLKAGGIVEWMFADVGASLSVDVKQIVPDSKILSTGRQAVRKPLSRSRSSRVDRTRRW
jgi:uncharacterized protein YndB with AHSA1/START domain